MKKKAIGLLLCFVLLFTACGNLSGREENPTPTPTQTPTPTVTATPSPSPSPTPSPSPSPSPTPTETPGEALKKNLTETTENGLYYDAGYELKYCDSIKPFRLKSGLVLFYDSYDFETDTKICYLVAYDYVTHKKIKTVDDAEMFYNASTMLIDEDKLFLFDSTNMIGYIFDGSLNLLDSFSLALLGRIGGCVPNADGSGILFSNGGKKLYLYDFASKSLSHIFTFEVENVDYVYNLLRLSGNQYYAYMDYYEPETDDYLGCTLIADLDTGKTTVQKDGKILKYSYDEKTGRKIVSEINPYNKIGVFDKDDRLITDINYTDSDEPFYVTPDWERNVLVTCSYNMSDKQGERFMELRCYSLEDGSLVSDAVTHIKSNDYSEFEIDTELGMVYFTSSREDEDYKEIKTLFYWDYSNDGVEPKDDIYVKRTSITQKFSNEIEDKRKALEEKYGIYIYLGYEITDVDFGFDLEVVTDEYDINYTLDLLKSVLSTYPDDFFRQLKTGSIRTLGFYLCGTMTGRNSESVDSAVGLANDLGYERALALNLNYGNQLEGTIYHEVSHWIDRYINSVESFGLIKDFEKGFNALNPIEDYYANSYVDYGVNYEYTYKNEYDSDNVYSVDEYGRTYATEDRARMFEYIMANQYYSSVPLYRYPFLLRKYEYFFKAIRMTFDTTDWPDKTWWENNLDDWIRKYERESRKTYEHLPDDAVGTY
jgi:hypothetical protein